MAAAILKQPNYLPKSKINKYINFYANIQYNLVSRTPGDLLQYTLVSRTPGDLIQYNIVSRTPGDLIQYNIVSRTPGDLIRSPGVLLTRLYYTSAHTLARSLHDVSCTNKKRFAVVVCFRVVFHASGTRIFWEIFEFKIFFKFCTITMTY